MKLIAQINDEQQEIEIKKDGGKVFAEIDGRKYELEASKPEQNVYLFKRDGKVFEVFVSPKANINEPFKIKVGTDDFEVNITDPKKLRGTGAGSGSAEGIAEIKTAMPGKVVRILLEKDSEVKTGEGVIVVEAMKMQNELKSPKDGIVKEIRFNEGETVNAGDVLVVIE